MGQRKPGTYPRAIENFQTAAKIYRELGDPAGEGAALLGVGLVQALSGSAASSSQTYQTAIGLFRSIKQREPDERALANLGFLYDELVDKQLGFKHDDLSIELPKQGFDRNGDRIDTRFSQLDERYSLQYFNQPFTVYVSFERANGGREDSRLAGADQPPKPVSFYPDVLAIWRLNGVESLEVATRVNLMETWAPVNPQVAVFYGKQAVNGYQALRRSLQQTQGQGARRYVNQLSDKFRFLADLLIGLGRLAEAEDVLQMLKEEEFSEFVLRDAAEIKGLRRRVRLTAKEQRLIDRYILLATRATEIGEQFRRLEDKRSSLTSLGKTLSVDDEATYGRLSTQVADINAAFALFLDKELVNEVGTSGADTIAADRRLQNEVREWSGGTVALYTVVTENRYRVVLTSPTVQIDRRTEISAAVLNKKIFAFRKALEDANVDPRPLGKELYDILVKPIEKDLAAAGARTLVWSLDGTLRYIPMAALSPDGRTYLVERYQNVTITPRTRESFAGKNVAWTALGMGVAEEQTVTYPDLPGEKIRVDALPAAREELMAIVRDEDNPAEKGIIPGKRYLDKEFTVKNMTDSLARRTTAGGRKFTLVHLASHFRLGNNWSNSFLFLGNSKLLTLEELATSPAINFNDVELVTLSACSTAIATASNGLEVDSLAEAIQVKSGKAVLATLWGVYDESTAQLMRNFYSSKQNSPGLTKAEALQQAQRKMLGTASKGDAPATAPAGATKQPRFTPDPARPFAHPYFWSGFVLIGNWR